MKRKILAAWKILTSDCYILCTINKDKPLCPEYDHSVTGRDVVYYNSFINNYYLKELNGQEDALRQAKEILNNTTPFN